MSIQAAKGYLKRLRLSSGDLMFRVLLLATLLNVAFIFGSSYPPAVNASQQALQLTQDRTTHVRRGEADNAQQKESIWRWLRHDAAGFFTLWLVVVGGGQLVLFWVQLVFIRKSLDDAKVAANAARDGARAAQDSADIAKLSMIAGDRAYVHFNGCRWISHRVDENSKVFWRLRPLWINSGNTPTRKLHVYVHYELIDNLLAADYQFAPTTDDRRLATIAPKGLIESAPHDFFGDDLLAVKEGRKHLYVWGIAKYRDVFPNTAEHITKFCVEAPRITGDPLEPWDERANIFDIAFMSIDRHNCADEDCDE